MKAQVAHVVRTSGAADWRATVEDKLLEVEQRLLEAVDSDVPTVLEISKHLVCAGGKRLRPALVILAAQAVQGSLPRTRIASIAAAVELIHMATLVHDDVIDGSDSRRGRVTANAFWGNKVSILSGDCMLAKAFSYLARDADQRIMQVIADMTIRMSESEVLQAMCVRDVDAWRKHYWQIIQHKTAGFLSACCRCGAILAGASESVEDALAEYGMELGLAFQLTDDLLDIVGDPEITGKPVGSDFREGNITMPMLLALDSITEADRLRACTLIERDDITTEQLNDLCRMIHSTKAVEMTRDRARSYAEHAESLLDVLPPSAAKDALTELTSQIIYRIH